MDACNQCSSLDIFYLFFNVHGQASCVVDNRVLLIFCLRLGFGMRDNQKDRHCFGFFTVCIFLPEGPEGHLIDLLLKPPRCVMNNVEL